MGKGHFWELRIDFSSRKVAQKRFFFSSTSWLGSQKSVGCLSLYPLTPYPNRSQTRECLLHVHIADLEVSLVLVWWKKHNIRIVAWKMLISNFCHWEICGLRARTRPGDICCQAASRQLRAQLCHELAFQHFESSSALFAWLEMTEEGGGSRGAVSCNT